MEPGRFKKGDRLICLCKKKKFVNGKWQFFRNTKVRVTNVNINDLHILPLEYTNYNVYNITLDKYDCLAHMYLKLDTEYYREQKLNQILK
jgi:hypothetical protein